MRQAAAILALIVSASPLLAQHEHHAGAETLGTVSFPTSCTAAVQPDIDRAVAMLHSFWFDRAIAEFRKVAEADPTCAMAHWGIAMTLLGNPFIGQPSPPARERQGLAAAERALALASHASPRERGYIEAALALWKDPAKHDHVARRALHEEAMRSLHEAYPDDREAAAFYARAVIANAPPTDREFKRQLYAGALLEPLFEGQPEHPGLAHYIIHTFDSPKLATNALAAAQRYARIAPDAPHALHMPSHIFTRLGYWDESIETNRRSAAAEPDSNAAVHPNDYLVYAYLQQGRDSSAAAVISRLKIVDDAFYGGAIIGYNAVAMPARYALERSAWADAAATPVPPRAAPFVEAVTRFTRAIGAARSGRLEQARAEVAALAALRDTLKQKRDSYWATIVEAQRLAASAWVAQGEGRTADALRLAKEGAELEESVEKHPVTPGPLLPARELLGDLLMTLDRPAEALVAYEATLEREPKRARALFGAAVAAEKAGKAASARRHYTELAQLMDRADSTRPEPKAAQTYLSRTGAR